jgi:formylglycine-generating enzyme required for sulfatase activity
MEQRTIIALLVILIMLISGAWAISYFNLRGTDIEVPFLATEAFQSDVAEALTAVAPTATPLPPPTVPPTATPETLIHLPTKARMLFIPGGQFTMGNDESEDEDEQPAHPIRLDDFFIDETEVTNGQYAVCVEDGACPPPQRNSATYHPAYYGTEAFDDYPVIHVTWNHAQTFCEWRDARLPTEAEWEYVAGFDPEVGIKLNYPWGNAFDGTQLNFCDINCPNGTLEWNDTHSDTAPATSFPDGRSPYGAYNMSGNVYEWVIDWYSTDYYGTSVEINPYGPLEGEAKVIRGGSWISDGDDVTVTARGRYLPSVSRANVGFRCATSAE